VRPVYSAEDLLGLTDTDTVPGAPPFVRGPYATMYTARPWTIRQYAGFSTAEESNHFYRVALAEGQRGLSVAFDLPTHRGYDSDHPRVQGDVGKAGVAIDSVEDMIRLFAQIPLEQVSVSMTMNGAVLPILAAYIVAAEEQSGAGPAILSKLRGTIQNDILKEFLVRNTFIYPPKPSMRIVSDVIEYCSRHLPKFNPVSISGYHFQEAGATADLELAFTLADGLEYVRSAVARGLDVDDFAPRLSFFFGVGMDLFLEVAKLRAARLLWAELMQREFAPKNPDSLRLRTHCQTSGVSLTAQQPLNNIVRTTVEALAAVLGGTQSLHTNAFDEALALPSDESARVARSTQLILQHETGLTRVVDPLAGSYYVESLTAGLKTRASELITELQAAGGMTEAIAQGLPQARIARAAAAKQLRQDRGTDLLVGVNCFCEADGKEPDVRFVSHEQVLQVQSERLEQLRSTRDAVRVDAALDKLEAGARAAENLLALSVECMRARATVGEVSARLERVFTRHIPVAGYVAGVYAAGYAEDVTWQRLRESIEAFESNHGRRPRILVAKLGQDGHDRGAKVVASGFADLGFDVDLGPLFQTANEVARAAVDSDVHVVGISTQAAAHLTLVPELIQELRSLDASDVLVVCGGVIPVRDHAALRRAGVAAVFEPGRRVLECAEQVMALLASRS
jgi:methylmalonyl-CoA mutase